MTSIEQKLRAESIGDRIVSARKRKGMSQVKLSEALSERSGVPAETVRRSLVNNETGKFSPRLRTLEAIAEITGQPLSFFLGPVEVGPEADTFPGQAVDSRPGPSSGRGRSRPRSRGRGA